MPKPAKPKVKKTTTVTIVLEVETTATARDLKKRDQWGHALNALGHAGCVRQVTVQVADRTK